MLYEEIAAEVRSLQQAYLDGGRAKIVEAHTGLVRRGLELVVRGSTEALETPGLVETWTDLTLEGALAILKSVELANEFDPKGEAIPDLDRRFLLLLSASEFYRSGRHGVASAILARSDAALPATIPDSPVLVLGRVLAQLGRGLFSALPDDCQRSLHACKHAITELIREATSTRLTLGYLSVTASVSAIRCITDYLQTGEEAKAEQARSWISDALELSTRSGDGELGLLTEALGRSIASLEKLSIWSAVRVVWPREAPSPLALKWVQHRIRQNKAVLFPTQYEALVERRILDRSNSLVSMPTGGGKSLIAEIACVKALASNPNSKVIFIVPSRALAAEKRDELSLALGWSGSDIDVCQLTGDVALDSEDALASYRVFVMTPEKFDILLRSDFFGEAIGLLVVDEFQTLRTEHRGIKLQLAISRFRKRRGTPALYISAIIRGQDIDALSQWAMSPNPFSTEWRPTPYRIGIVPLDYQPWRVEFNDGTHQTIEPSQTIRRSAKNQASVEVVSKFLENDQVLHFSLYWRGYRLEDNVLLDLAEDYRRRMPPLSYANLEARKELEGRLTRILGAGHRVVQAFGSGIAVQWSDLPAVARRIVEEGVRRKAIGLVIATSTLAEGVNLPIKTVFMSKLATRRGPMSIGQFLNVAGRAGRPYFHSEGQLVIGTNSMGPRASRTSLDEARRFAGAGRSDVERMTTAAVLVAEGLQTAVQGGFLSSDLAQPTPLLAARRLALGRSPRRQTGFEPADEMPLLQSDLETLASSMLACLEEGLLPSIARSRALEDVIFIGPESPEERASVGRLLGVIQERLIHFGVLSTSRESPEVTPWGGVVYRTGLGPESCSKLDQVIQDLGQEPQIPEIRVDRLLQEGLDRDLALRTARWLTLPLEAGATLHRPIPDFEAILVDWMGGLLLQGIAQRHSALRRDYLAAFSQLELLSFFGAWVYYAASLIAQHRIGESPLSRSFLNLARTSLYGHPSKFVQELLKRDIRREILRDDAIALYAATTPAIRQRILESDFSEAALVELLEKGNVRTRMTEKEVASAVVRVVRSG